MAVVERAVAPLRSPCRALAGEASRHQRALLRARIARLVDHHDIGEFDLLDQEIDQPALIRLAGARKAMKVVDAVAAARDAGRKYITVASEVLGEAAA